MQYAGEDNLDVLRLAKNYNQALVDDILDDCDENCEQILDFGAGEGYLSALVEAKINKKVLNIEPAENLQKFYQGRMHQKSLDAVADNSVDYIYSSNVLEHIEDDAAIVEDFYHKLKNGGKIFLYLPAFNVLYSSMDKKVGHYRRYTKDMLQNLFADKTKWQIERLSYADFAGYFVTLLYKIVGNKQGDISSKSVCFYDKFIFPISRMLDKLTRGKVLGKNVRITVKKIG